MNTPMTNQPPILSCCRKCKRTLIPDEIAITKKLINRGTSVYYCIDCLAETFEVKREDIEAKIQYYKEIGCTLFTKISY